MLQTTIDPNRYETTLNITGAGGFGKTNIAISLCHQTIVKEHFTDGVVFIELGPQATDPSIKLRAVYNLLANEQCDINVVEMKINQLISDYYRNLLVIIDDVWHVEDAQPLVKAFSSCKTILTTRMNDIGKYIPSQQSFVIGPMSQHEAISLLTGQIIDVSQLSQEDVNLLHELAQDVHLWPLLLCLIRGQLSHSLKQLHLPYHDAIQTVQAKLHHKGLVAFDKNNVETIHSSRQLAVKACIEISLELLSNSLTGKLKTLILWIGIGTSLETVVLHNLWNISKQVAEEIVDVLWNYGLIQFTDIVISPNNSTQHCVEVHAVISQYIIETMDNMEVDTFSPVGGKLNTIQSVQRALLQNFPQLYGVHNPSTLADMDYLKYKLSQIENLVLPYFCQMISIYTVNDPHRVIVLLQKLKENLITLKCSINLLSLGEDVDLLIVDCRHILKDTHKLCRKLNQKLQRNFYNKAYDELIEIVEVFIKDYPLCLVAQKAVLLVNRILPYCDAELTDIMMEACEYLQMLTPNYHYIATFIIPKVKLYNKLHKQIASSLHNGSPDIKLTYRYIMSGKFDEEEELVATNQLIKLQEVAPKYVHEKASQQY